MKAKEESKKNGHLVMEPKEWSCSPLSLHEWQVWFEEEGIVICSNEALPVTLLVEILACMQHRCLLRGSYLVVKALRTRLTRSPIVTFGPWSGPIRSAMTRSGSKIFLKRITESYFCDLSTKVVDVFAISSTVRTQSRSQIRSSKSSRS